MEYCGYKLGSSAQKNNLPRLQLKPCLFTSFPATDIYRGMINEHNFILEFSLMGLYGVDSPLPNYFIQASARDDDSGACMRAFMDIFNQRFYYLLYQAWKKYQPLVEYEQGHRHYAKLMRALSGHALHDADQEEHVGAGLLGAKQHHRAGLEGLLQAFLGHNAVTVLEFIPRWIAVTTHGVLGAKDYCLGEDVLLGTQLLTCTQQLQITIGPVLLQAAYELFPTGTLGIRIWHLTKRYIQPAMDFCICLQIQIPENSQLRLGIDPITLGWASWVGLIAQSSFSVRIGASVWAYYSGSRL